MRVAPPVRKVAAVLILALVSLGFLAPATSAADNQPIYRAVKGDSGPALDTPWLSEAQKAVDAHGFTDYATLFRASTSPADGLVPAYRMYHPRTQDFFVTTSVRERDNAIGSHGYESAGVRFYVSSTRTDGRVAVHRYIKGNYHRLAVTSAQRTRLEENGWRHETVAFYASPAGSTGVEGDGEFSMAIVPDTQREVWPESDRLLEKRTTWIAGQKSVQDVRFVGHTGDMVDSGGSEQDLAYRYQFDTFSDQWKPVENAGIPSMLSIGNHDGAAVCNGGSACPGVEIWKAVRDTRVLNSYFPPSRTGIPSSQSFEAGKLDNAYRTFTAEGTKWMVLTLEFAPRRTAVAWAAKAIAAHPDHNVVVMSHYLLDGNGGITTSNGGYGETSGRYVYDNLILKYPNVRLAFSGHAGRAASRVDTGANGNKVASFLGTFHEAYFNPTRMVRIDLRDNTVTSDIKAVSVRSDYLKANPGATPPSYDEYDKTVTGMNWVR